MSGVGIVLVALVAALLYRQIPDGPAVIGMVLIILGIYPSYLKIRISNFVFCVKNKVLQFAIELAITHFRTLFLSQNTLL